MKINKQTFLYLFSLFLTSASIRVTSQVARTNPAPAALVLGCGSAESGKDADGRSWEPDGKFLQPGDRSIMTKADTQDPALSSAIPYMTARIFPSESTYLFPLQNSSSRTLLRLHFYPSSYPNHNITNSYFSVVAGGVTLLSNFSASLAAEALSQAYFIKEYYLAPSRTPNLNITFRPSDQQNQSFAFVNGIELISAPNVFDEDPVLVGFVQSNSDVESVTTVPIDTNSMETMYRLNVGGQYIAPSNDSAGLMRSWYDDSLYIFGAGDGVAMEAEKPVTYNGLPPYMAPLSVYGSYRAMAGSTGEVNVNFNLTWIFEVDPNFMYLLRFHWCDTVVTMPNQRVFDVFINNRTASTEVDIYTMTQSFATPTKRDYAIRVNNRTGDSQIWVSLTPDMKTKAEFANVLLNGLEIFKISDHAKANLAGPNPTISDMMKRYKEAQMEEREFEQPKRTSSKTILITGAAGGAAAFGIAAAIFLATHRRKKRVGGGDNGTSWLPISWNNSSTVNKSGSGRSQGATAISADAACNCRYFNLSEIKTATKNFDESNVIGVGGFGKVYKGVIDGDTQVAIKRSNPSSEQGVNEFQTEIEMLSRLRHRHLVSLIGFCEDNGEMILVYDYMGQGTMREHLYKGNKFILTWKQRLDICIGAARGLHYLHTGAKYTIIHRDVKTTNILLDDKWVAKVSDFGLSKTGPNMNNGNGHVSTVVKGSFGYLDPEYFRRQQLTEKSDVYSFGVVLFEVLCARPALNPSLPKEQVSLADWAMRCARNNTLDDIIDPQLKGNISPECLHKFTDTATKCLADHGIDRPSMGDVLWNLESCLQLQDSNNVGGDSVKKTGSVDLDCIQEVVDHNSLIAMHRSTLSLGDDDEVNGDKNNDNADDIFSQIVNPKGR